MCAGVQIAMQHRVSGQLGFSSKVDEQLNLGPAFEALSLFANVDLPSLLCIIEEIPTTLMCAYLEKHFLYPTLKCAFVMDILVRADKGMSRCVVALVYFGTYISYYISAESV